MVGDLSHRPKRNAKSRFKALKARPKTKESDPIFTAFLTFSLAGRNAEN
jgi:hypothetical protein